MKNVLIILLSFLGGIFILFTPNFIMAGEKADSSIVTETKLTLKYLCLSNDSVLLTANLSVRKGDNVYSLKNAPIDFVNNFGPQNKPLGKVISDQEGNGSVTIGINGLTGNNEGMISYSAKFPGTDKYNAASANYSAKPARLQLSFNIQDSVRMLNVAA
ncbi:MAG: hypothetical protein WCI71_19910, partial [Bacteroidota bacterium]